MTILRSKLMPLISAYLYTRDRKFTGRPGTYARKGCACLCVLGERSCWGWVREVSSQSLSNRACCRGLQNVLWFTEEINIDFATRRIQTDLSNGRLCDLRHRPDDTENQKTHTLKPWQHEQMLYFTATVGICDWKTTIYKSAIKESMPPFLYWEPRCLIMKCQAVNPVFKRMSTSS